MGGTNVSQTPTSTQTIAPTSGNIGAGAALYNATVMPVDLQGVTSSTLSITDVSPGVFAAAAAVANKALESNELVTNGALNLATSEAQRANDLAASSTGSGPYANLIKSAGIYILGGLAVITAIVGMFWYFGHRKKEKAA